MQPASRCIIVAPEVLELALFEKVRARQRFESNEQAAQSPFNGMFEQVRGKHRVDSAGSLPQTPHAAHALEQRGGKPSIAEEMIVEKIEMAAREALDLCKCRVHGLGVEGSSA